MVIIVTIILLITLFSIEVQLRRLNKTNKKIVELLEEKTEEEDFK
ncbi:hypothetical protein [Sporosarcina sp. FSL K6-3508]